MTKHYNNRGKGYIKKICFNIKQLFNSLFIRMLDKLKLICSTLKSHISAEKTARSLQKGLENFYRISPRRIAYALIVNGGIGFYIIYKADTFQQYWIHIVCITLCMALTIIIGRKYRTTIHLLDKEIEKENTSDNTELRVNYRRFKDYAFHKANLIFCIVIPCIFFWAIFKQNYLSFDIVGIYGVLIIRATLFMSILGYVEYMWMLWFLYRIGKCEHFYYNQSNPSQTPFLIYIADITNCAKWFFLIEAFLYIFEYFILIPREKLTINQFQMPDNFSFFVTWIILFIVLVLAFPIIVLSQEAMMAKIIDNLKQEQIQNLSLSFNIASQDLSNNTTISQAYMYNSMMANIVASNDYPIKARRLGPALISLATFVLHTVNLLSQLPPIGSWISQFYQQYL